MSRSVDPETSDSGEGADELPWIRLPGPDSSPFYYISLGLVAVALVLFIVRTQLVAGSELGIGLLYIAGFLVVAGVSIGLASMAPLFEGVEFQVHPTEGTRFIIGRWAVPRERRLMRGPYRNLFWLYLGSGTKGLMGFDDDGHIAIALSELHTRQEEATRLLGAAGVKLSSKESWRETVGAMPRVLEGDPPLAVGPGAQAARASRVRDATLTLVCAAHMVSFAVALRSLNLSIVLLFVGVCAVVYAGAPHWRGHLLRVQGEQLILELHGPFGFTSARRRPRTVPRNEVRFELKHVGPLGDISIEVYRAGERERLRTILWPLSEIGSFLRFCRAWNIAYVWSP